VDTPAVLLDNMTAPGRAANIPEFVNLAASNISLIRERFVSGNSFVRTGEENEKLGDFAGAERFYRIALKEDPCNADVQMRLGNMLHLQGKHDAAVEAARKALVGRLSRPPSGWTEAGSRRRKPSRKSPTRRRTTKAPFGTWRKLSRWNRVTNPSVPCWWS
jgi:tetratricopeptide (TPR) repeat protein